MAVTAEAAARDCMVKEVATTGEAVVATRGEEEEATTKEAAAATREEEVAAKIVAFAHCSLEVAAVTWEEGVSSILHTSFSIPRIFSYLPGTSSSPVAADTLDIS